VSLLLVCANALKIPLPDDSVQCCVTSPPYWGLRRYAGEQEFVWSAQEDGAWRGAYGLEPSIEMYVAHTVDILHEIWRVLRSDGVCFWNIGDSYAGGGNYRGLNSSNTLTSKQASNRGANGLHQELGAVGKDTGTAKPKDLCLIPSRVALAAQADGWWVRSMIVWAKPNPMPESVTDRPTDAYEHIIMLTKSARYYWDADAVSMTASASTLARLRQPTLQDQAGSNRIPGKTNGPMKACFGGRQKHSGYGNRKDSGREDDGNYIENGVNIRNVWVFSPQPYKEAHFATFPEELPRRCILAASKVGDLILDPFGGSGTTGRLAVQLRRRAILLDLAYTHDYGRLAKKRTRNVQLEAFA
jgi:DNA modification methylase